MCPHHRTPVSKLVLTQGNMVISCSSAFYPSTFCLSGMLFLFIFLAHRKIRAYPQTFCQLPIQLLYLLKGPGGQTEALTLTPLVLLRAPGPSLTGLPWKLRRKCPLMHPSWFFADSTHWPSGLLSLLCTQLGLGSGNFLQDSAFSPHIFANQDA